MADMCTLLKTLRIKKIKMKIEQSNMHGETKAKMIILFWLIVIVLYTHIFSCLIWWILKEDELWINAIDMGTFELRIYFAEMVSHAKT